MLDSQLQKMQLNAWCLLDSLPAPKAIWLRFETLKADRRSVSRFTLNCKLRVLGPTGGAMPNELYGRFHLGRYSPVDGAVVRFRTNFVVSATQCEHLYSMYKLGCCACARLLINFSKGEQQYLRRATFLVAGVLRMWGTRVREFFAK